MPPRPRDIEPRIVQARESHYNLGRKRTTKARRNPSSRAKHLHGLAIILVDACARSVCRRASWACRVVHKEGNHTWVEIWDGEWFFTGADEYDKHGLDRGCSMPTPP